MFLADKSLQVILKPQSLPEMHQIEYDNALLSVTLKAFQSKHFQPHTALYFT